MNRKWLFAGALASAVMLGASSRALADDYCARPDSRQNVYVDRYSSQDHEGYGYTRPYDGYGEDDAYQQNDRRYDDRAYGSYSRGQYRSSRPYYEGRHDRRGYGVQTFHEDHIRTTFRPFPFPRIEKRIVHHEHPIY